MECKNCGYEIIEEDISFCPKCGQDLNENSNKEVNFLKFESFSFIETLSYSWEVYKKNIGVWTGFLFFILLLGIVPFVNFIVGLIFPVMIFPFSLIAIFKYEKKEELKFSELFEGFNKFLSYIGLMFLQMLLSIIFVIVTILPVIVIAGMGADFNIYKINAIELSLFNGLGLIAIIFFVLFLFFYTIIVIAYLFTAYRIFLNDDGVISNYIKSFKIGFKNIFPIIGYCILLTIISLLVTLCTLGIGIIVMYPLTTIFMVVLYLKYHNKFN